MRILADPGIACAAEAFAGLGEVELLAGRQWTAAAVRDRDVLLVRSVTRVNESLLGASRVRFVGSATSGIDHVDTAALARRGIAFAHAPGSNAEAVVDYVLGAIAAGRHALGPGTTVGIVGCGAVGARLRARLQALGLRCLCSDPPLERAGAAGPFQPLEALVAGADVITLHVPLTDAGPFATAGLLGAARLRLLRGNATLINAARGGVVDEAALLERLRTSHGPCAVVDCWQGEPAIGPELLRRAWIATPHIAGYSLDGRLAATRALFTSLCRHLGREAHWPAAVQAQVPPAPVLEAHDGAVAHSIRKLVLACYDPRLDSAALKAALALAPAARSALFDRLRRDYPARREFGFVRVRVPANRPDLRRAVAGAGFRVVDAPSAPGRTAVPLAAGR